MSVIISKATPRYILNGTNDISGRPALPEPPQTPQHLPNLMIFTPKGPTLPQLVSGDSAISMYGADAFKVHGKYANHQTIIANRIMGAGQQVFIERLIPPLAKKAMLRRSIELIATTLEVYERNPDGSYKIEMDQEGNSVPVVAETIVGLRAIHHIGVSMYSDKFREFGEGTIIEGYRNGDVTIAGGVKKLGEIVTDTGNITTRSILFPVMDFRFNSVGEEGDLNGIEWIAPTTKMGIPANVSVIEAVRAYTYRVGVKRRATPTSTAYPIRTAGEDVYIEVTLKENVEHPTTNDPISMIDTFTKAYEMRESDAAPPIEGPFSDLHIYSSNIQQILTMLTQGGEDPDGNVFLGEKAYDTKAATYGRLLKFSDDLNLHLFNFFTGRDYRNVPYFASDFQNSILFGGVGFNNGAAHFATGGDDGLPLDDNGRPDRLARFELADRLTREKLDNFGEGEATLLDAAYYPISAVWDSGFSHRAKPSFFVPMGRRKDILAHVCTQAIADYVPSPEGEKWEWKEPNTHDEEISYAISLRTQAMLYPESTLFNTAAFRAVIMGHAGHDTRDNYRGWLPLIIDFAEKVARYMGAADGKWKERWAFDQEGNNEVNSFQDVNLTYKSPENYDRSWDAGLNWVVYKNRTQLFYPAIQTVYEDDTSVLNSYFVAAAICTLERICQRSWAAITGNQKLTKEQIRDRSNTFIQAAAEGAFDGRFDITVNTYFTKADDNRGYSWSCDVTLATDTMPTVGTFTLIAARRDEQGNLIQ